MRTLDLNKRIVQEAEAQGADLPTAVRTAAVGGRAN
jgi:hypothetical protein